MDHLRNTDIRQELDIEPVTSTIERAQMRWLGHLLRMNKKRPTRLVWEFRQVTARDRGRPATTWNKAIEKILQCKNMTWSGTRREARNPKSWADLVYR